MITRRNRGFLQFIRISVLKLCQQDYHVKEGHINFPV